MKLSRADLQRLIVEAVEEMPPLKLSRNDLRTLIEGAIYEGQYEERVKQALSHPKFEKNQEHVKAMADGLKSKGLANVGYLNWGLNQLLGAREVEGGSIVPELVGLIHDFNKLKGGLPNKDISAYKSAGDLRGAIEDRVKNKEKRVAKSDQMSQVAKEAHLHLEKAIKESDILIGGDTPELIMKASTIVVLPHSKFASQFWGNPGEFACEIGVLQGSVKWCTAATKSHNYFDSYSGQNIFLYYAIDKTRQPTDKLYKIAFAASPDTHPDDTQVEIFDAEDDSYNMREMSEEYGGKKLAHIWNVIKTHMGNAKETKNHQTVKQTKSKTTSPEVLDKIAQSTNEEETLNRIYYHPNTSLQTLVDLWNSQVTTHSTTYLQPEPILKNAELTPEILENFYKSKQNWGMDALCDMLVNKNCTPELAREIVFNRPTHSKDGYAYDNSRMMPYLYEAATRNWNMSPDILREIYKKEKNNIKDDIAMNPNTPSDVLYDLYLNPPKDTDFGYAIAGNPSVPRKIIELILSGHNKDKDFDLDQTGVINFLERKFLSANPAITEEDQEALYNMFLQDTPLKQKSGLRTMAKNPNISPTILQALYNVFDQEEEMNGFPSEELGNHLAANPKVPPDDVLKIAYIIQKRYESAAGWVNAAGNPNPAVANAVAPAAIAASHWHGGNNVILTLVRNPAVKRQYIEAIAADLEKRNLTDDVVWNAAKNRLNRYGQFRGWDRDEPTHQRED